MMKPISSYIDSNALRALMANAKRLNQMEIYWQAFRRVCQLEGLNHDDPLERDFYAALAAYEELLSEKNGRRTRANRTRQKLARKGIVGCLEDWTNQTARTEGFYVLVENGYLELTGEYLVTKYPDRFSHATVERAKLLMEVMNWKF